MKTLLRKAQTLLTIYRSRGILAVRDSILEKLPVVDYEYQQRIAHVFQDRQAIICSLIPSSTQNVLDIGSNLGDVALSIAANRPCHVLAWEPDERTHRRAIRRGSHPNVAFCTGEFGPHTVGNLPDYDVILLLNVYHNWAKQYGVSAARQMLRVLGNKARLLVVRGSTRRSFGGATPPEFTSHSREDAFWLSFLASTFPGANVSLAGSVDAGQHMTQPVMHLYSVETR